MHCLINLARIKPLVVFGPQGEVDTYSYIVGPVMELTQWVKRDWHRQRADQLTITVTVTELQLQLQLHSYRPVTYHTCTCTHKHSHAKMPVEYNHACSPTNYTCGYSNTTVPQDCSIVTQTIYLLLAKPTN